MLKIDMFSFFAGLWCGAALAWVMAGYVFVFNRVKKERKGQK